MRSRRTIYVLRHAKSDWDADYASDHDRPLNKRGRRAAKLIGRYLRSIDQIPETVLSSSALRARETVELAASAGEWESRIQIHDSLYMTSVSQALDLARGTERSVSTTMIVGHQPMSSQLVADLTGGSRVRFPTAALARIDFSTASWSQINPAEGSLIWLVVPKILQAGS